MNLKKILTRYELKTNQFFCEIIDSFSRELKIFKDKNIENSKESVRRSKKSIFNNFGKMIDGVFKIFFSYQTLNIIIFIGIKK